MKKSEFTIRGCLMAAVCLWVAAAAGSNVLLYQKDSSPVTNRIVPPVLRAVDVPAVPTNYGTLVFSSTHISNWNGVLPSVPLQWCKASNNVVVALTAAESNSVVTAEANVLSNKLAQAQITAKSLATNYFDNLDEATKRVIRALAEVTRQAVNTNRVADGFPVITVIQWRDRVLQEINAQPNSQ